MHIYGKISNKDEITLEEVHQILDETYSIEDLMNCEIQIVKQLDCNIFCLSYIDCLEFIFYDNGLWHKSFYPLISLSQSVLLR